MATVIEKGAWMCPAARSKPLVSVQASSCGVTDPNPALKDKVIWLAVPTRKSSLVSDWNVLRI